jgi:hypothetical protein
MALSQYKFVGIRKNGSVATIVENGINEKDARKKANKVFKTITECRRITDVINEPAEVQASS